MIATDLMPHRLARLVQTGVSLRPVCDQSSLVVSEWLGLEAVNPQSAYSIENGAGVSRYKTCTFSHIHEGFTLVKSQKTEHECKDLKLTAEHQIGMGLLARLGDWCS